MYLVLKNMSIAKLGFTAATILETGQRYDMCNTRQYVLVVDMNRCVSCTSMLLVTSPYKTTVNCNPETSRYHRQNSMHDQSKAY